MNFTLDEEFRQRNRPHTKQERTNLELILEEEGCVADALTVAIIGTERLLCDGYTTYEICKAKGIKLTEPRCIVFKDRAAVLDWIDRRQRSRRNLTAEEMKDRREERRERVAEAREEGKSIRTIAEEEGVPRSTVADDVKAVRSRTPAKPRKKPEKVKGQDGKTYAATKPNSFGLSGPQIPDRFKKRGLVGTGPKPDPNRTQPDPSELETYRTDYLRIEKLMADEGDQAECLVDRIKALVAEVKKLRKIKPAAGALATVEEVAAYCKERGNRVDPEQWHDFYTSNGWKVGKNSMKDWRAAVRTWERNGAQHHGRVSRVEAPAGKYAGIGKTVRG